MLENDIYDAFRRIVVEETKYLRHYNGIVQTILDPTRGSVLATVPSLGWTDPITVYPRWSRGMILPLPNEIIDIGFMEGLVHLPVYYGIAREFEYPFQGQTPALAAGAARLGDTVESDITKDPQFWTWLSAAAVVLAGLGVVVPTPTSLTSKITSASQVVTVE
jgi:hypothetical protein